MRKLKILLHVGSVKTGSTALQNLFMVHQSTLSNKGVLYPEKPEVTAHYVRQNILGKSTFTSGNANDIFEIIDRFQTNDSLSDIKTEVIKSLTTLRADLTPNHHCLIISSENFSWLEDEKIELLLNSIRNTFDDFDLELKVICVMRNLLSHCASLWAHNVRRHAYAKDPVSYAREDYGNPILGTIHRYEQKLGAENVICLAYDDASTIFTQFLSYADIKKFNLPSKTSPTHNKGLGLRGLETLLRFSTFLPEGSWKVGNHFRLEVNELFWDFGDYLEGISRFKSTLISELPDTTRAEMTEALKSQFEDACNTFNSTHAPALEIEPPAKPRKPSKRTLTPATPDASPIEDQIIQFLTLRVRDGQFLSEEQLLRMERYNLIKNSGIFDAAYYLQIVSQLQPVPEDISNEVLISHFSQIGSVNNLNPSPHFDLSWYKTCYEDLENEDATEHYIKYGAREGRSPHGKISMEDALKYAVSGNLVAFMNNYKPDIRA